MPILSGSLIYNERISGTLPYVLTVCHEYHALIMMALPKRIYETLYLKYIFYSSE